MNNYLLIAVISTHSMPTFARGGSGSVEAAKLSLGLLVILVIGGLGTWLHKEYPSFFPAIEG